MKTENDIAQDDPMTEAVAALESKLHKSAEQTAGLSDWGTDKTYLIGLRILLRDLLDLPAPAAAGLTYMIENHLVQRLQMVADAQREPGMLAQPIERPVFVIGMARTGTTHLHNLLSLDPTSRSVNRWEMSFPSPPPDVATYDTDPRIAMTVANIEAFRKSAPLFESMHPLRPTDPVECEEFNNGQFAGTLIMWATFPIARHAKWTTNGGSEGLYEGHRRLLQQFQWRGPRGRWTLKCPIHIFNLDALLQAYPDACLVHIHREPATAFASHASLISTMRGISGSAPDPLGVARDVLKTWGPILDKSTLQRQADPDLDAKIFNVAYRDLARDPVTTVRSIHERLSLPFTQAHEDRIREYTAVDSERLQTKGHKYDAADYGIDRAELAKSFPAYRARFGDLL